MCSYLVLGKHSKNHLQNFSFIYLLHVKDIETVVVAMTKADLQTQQSSFTQNGAEKAAMGMSIYQKNSGDNISMHWFLGISRYCKQILIHFSYH